MQTGRRDYFLTTGSYGFRAYDHRQDEAPVCKLCWRNALPGGRPFPLIPKAGALSFGRIVTGPYAEFAGEFFYVVDNLSDGKLVAYFTGAEGGAVETGDGEVSWMQFRDRTAERIAEAEFGEISLKMYMPVYSYLESRKLMYALSLGPRAIQFLLHAKLHNCNEMPDAPECPEFHFHVAKGHRGNGIGRRLIQCFVKNFPEKKYKKICAQVTVCEGYKTLKYYKRMTYKEKRVWEVYDKRETRMYTSTEKQAWGLGPKVENVSLVANKKRLLAFVSE